MTGNSNECREEIGGEVGREFGALTERQLALNDAAAAVCKHCREGRDVINGEWHAIKLTATPLGDEWESMVYCIATPIRRLP